MVKKLFTYIFIYTLLVGCDIQDPISSNDICESNCYLEIGAPSLQIDNNGYYHMEWLDGYQQTFSTLDANTGSNQIRKVYWGSESGIEYGGDFVSCVNPASYTNKGTTHTVVGVWEEMVGDTILIYAGYYDHCSNEHKDVIGIIVDNEI